MSTEVLSQNLVAGVKATFGSGSAFVIVAALGVVTIVARSIGTSANNRTFTNVPAGFKFTADTEQDGFSTLEVTSATNQAFTIAVGDDDVEFSNAVTVTGGVVTQETPAISVADTASIVTAAGQNALCPQNLARRRITVFAEPANAGVVYIRKGGGANNLAFIQPGTSVEFDGTYALDYAGGAANVLYIFEES